jgi:polyisoprenoid-binding protein YceI
MAEVDPSGELTLTGSASVASVQVRVAEMVAHLQAPDFFDVERHPDVTSARRPCRSPMTAL